MATLVDRRLPRADYQRHVFVTLPSRDEPFEAQAFNLSERGIFIGTDVQCDVGSTLRVLMPLGDGELDVEGRVAWSRPHAQSGDPAGLGIEFTDLDCERLEEIKSHLGSDKEHAIRVRFDGLSAPIKARARVIGDHLSLHTELPFLRLGSVSDFALEGDANSHRGRIRRVSIEPGGSEDVPRLRIEVDVLGVGSGEDSSPLPRVARGTDAPANGEKDSETDQPEEPTVPLEVRIPPAPPSWVEPARTDSTERVARPRRWLLASGAAAACGFVATFALLRVGSGWSWASAPESLDLATYPDEGAPAAVAAMEAPALTVAPTQASASPTPVASPAVQPTTTELEGFSVIDEGPVTTIKFSLQAGSVEGARHYLLADPIGVAVNLPSGLPTAERKVHHLDHPTINKIWVRDYDSGSQLRVFVKGDEPPTYSVVAIGQQVAVILERH